MMKNSIFSMIGAALVAAAACPAVAQQPALNAYKIGIVDTQRVMRDSRLSRQIYKDLEAEFQKRGLEIEAGPQGEIERRKIALAEDMGLRREDALKQFIDKTNATIRRIAEAEKFDVVFLEVP